MTRLLTLFFLACLLIPQASWSFDERDPLLVEASVSPVDWSPGQAGLLTLKVGLPKNYHGYEDQVRLTLLEPDGFHLGPPTITPIVTFFDKFSKKNRRGFKETAEITAGIQAPLGFNKVSDRMRIELVYQACSETFCLFPTTKTIDVPITLVKPRDLLLQDEPSKVAPSAHWGSVEHLDDLLSDSWPLAFLFVFLAGIITSFTPCIFPMIPITLAVIGHEAEKRSRTQNFLLSLLYVHGIATTYAVLGLIAASSGALFGASLGSPWVLGVLCALFLIMSLGMYGLFELQVPAVLRQTLGTKKTAPGYVGAYLSGLIAGVVASPCVGPVLVGLLAWVSMSGSHLMGFFLLFTYAMGLGLIFLVLGAFTELTRLLPRSGAWLQTTKFILGTLMLGVFYYYLSFLLPQRWHDGALGIGLLILGSLAGAFSPLKGTAAFKRIQKGFAQALLIIGFGYLAFAVFDLRQMVQPQMLQPELSHVAGGANWIDYSEENFQKALKEKKPIVIDFWAEWCAACHELEQKTFRHNGVKARFENLTLLRFDATKDSPLLRDLKARWNIQGLPTVIFMDASGNWRKSLSLTEYESPERFLKRLDALTAP